MSTVPTREMERFALPTKSWFRQLPPPPATTFTFKISEMWPKKKKKVNWCCIVFSCLFVSYSHYSLGLQIEVNLLWLDWVEHAPKICQRNCIHGRWGVSKLYNYSWDFWVCHRKHAIHLFLYIFLKYFITQFLRRVLTILTVGNWSCVNP